MPASRRRRCATRWPRCCAAPRSARSTTTRRSSTRWSGACRRSVRTSSPSSGCRSTPRNGGYVPLEAVADVTLAPTPNEITREGGSRRIDVTTNVRDRDLGAVAQDIQTALAAVKFPEGYHAEAAGRVRGARGLAEPPAGHRASVAARHPAHPARRLRVGAAGRDGRPDASVRADWRRRGGVPLGWRAVARVAGRVRHGARHRRAERHHAREPLPPPRGRRRRAVRTRARRARRGGTAGADPDDGARHRPGPRADRRRRRADPGRRSNIRWRW